jgi:hypothetical protein
MCTINLFINGEKSLKACQWVQRNVVQEKQNEMIQIEAREDWLSRVIQINQRDSLTWSML